MSDSITSAQISEDELPESIRLKTERGLFGKAVLSKKQVRVLEISSVVLFFIIGLMILYDGNQYAWAQAYTDAVTEVFPLVSNIANNPHFYRGIGFYYALLMIPFVFFIFVYLLAPANSFTDPIKSRNRVKIRNANVQHKLIVYVIFVVGYTYLSYLWFFSDLIGSKNISGYYGRFGGLLFTKLGSVTTGNIITSLSFTKIIGFFITELYYIRIGVYKDITSK